MTYKEKRVLINCIKKIVEIQHGQETNKQGCRECRYKNNDLDEVSYEIKKVITETTVDYEED